MQQSYRCAACRRSVPKTESYIVRIEVLADPGMPAIDLHNEPDAAATIADLLEQMKQMTAEELQDQVYRKLEYRLCGRCHALFLANPLGLPRRRVHGRN